MFRHTVFVNICTITAPWPDHVKAQVLSPAADAVIHPPAWFLVHVFYFIFYWVSQSSQHKYSTLSSARLCIIYFCLLSNGPWWWQPYCLSTSLQFLYFVLHSCFIYLFISHSQPVYLLTCVLVCLPVCSYYLIKRGQIENLLQFLKL